MLDSYTEDSYTGINAEKYGRVDVSCEKIPSAQQSSYKCIARNGSLR